MDAWGFRPGWPGRQGTSRVGRQGEGIVAQQVRRWVEVTPSQFTHEAEGLNIIRALLPPNSPFRAWSNLEFRDGHGKWHEVNLVVLGRRRMHLVELKYYSGTLRGDDLTWRRDGHRAEDSPLKLARRKAQRLASKLQDELMRWAQESGARITDPRAVVPFVQESVFLHHPDLRCLLPPASRMDLFGLDGEENRTDLPGISERLLEAPTPHQSIGPNQEGILADLMQRIGIVQRRQREAGSWVIDEDALGEGDGWQDWPAFHRVATTERARIRFLVTPPGATATTRARIRQVAEHEYRITSRLASDRLLRPRDLVNGELGVGLVYPSDDRFQRLDLWLADHAASVPAGQQLDLLRQVAEAVSYAHRNRVVHRGLTPHAVWVRERAGDKLQALVGDWQSAGMVGGGPSLTGLSSSGVTGLIGAGDGTSAGNGADQTGGQAGARLRLGATDVDRRLAEAFQAPEGVWNRDADRIRLDVFALGALAYYILAGRPAAADRAALRERLHRDNGLDLAADLPQVPPAVRSLVLEATRPAVSERLPDVRSFLEKLAAAEQALAGPAEEVADPLEAAPGEVIDGRFELIRRLGRGSTAVGLLVTDLQPGGSGPGSGPEPRRVLKVAVDDAAAARIADEAKVLAGLAGPRLVKLVAGPLEVGTRQALLLESAGDETLAEVLRGRERLSLDLLERWGTDLLDALTALDRAGVDHRDIKPANLGVRETRDGAKHLVLFDFSLSRAGATAVTAGTPPYLDPFLDSPERGRHDSAAERYSAAVVLFEMATGTTPKFGDGMSNPAFIHDEAAVEPGLFDPAVAGALVPFFRHALARSAKERYDTAADMLAAWRKVFAPVPRTIPDDADERATAAQPATPLTEAGLSARALSALEHYGVATVADLVAVDPVRLNRLSGVAEATRREIKSRARQWRDTFGAAITGRGPGRRAESGPGGATLPDPVSAADLLMTYAGTARAASRRTAARLLLGLDPGLDPFSSQNELSGVLNVSRARAAQQVAALQDGWAGHPACRDLLDAVAGTARQALADFGGVATVAELTGAIRAALPPSDTGDAPASPARIAAGLLRLALDRAQALHRAEAGEEHLATRRRDGRIVLLATDAALLDPAEALGRAADDLVAQAQAAGEPLVPATRAAERLRNAWTRASAGQDISPGTLGDARLLRLAAELARDAVLSGSNELYHRDLSITEAMRLALRGVGGTEAVAPHEVRDRVRARFPALAPLPERPRLDHMIEEARLGLVYDEGQHGYRWPTRQADTKGLASRQATITAPAGAQLVSGGRSGHRLSESAAARSFLALGVDAARIDRAIEGLAKRCSAVVVDVTQVLIEAMRAQAVEVGLPWDVVQAADAAPQGSRDAAGLTVLVQRSLPAIDTAIEVAASSAPPGTQPVLLTELAPLARYGHLDMLIRWTEPGRPPPASNLGAGTTAAWHPRRHHRQTPIASRCAGPVLPPRRRVDRLPASCHRRRSIVTATAALTTNLQRQVLDLEDDLRARLQADASREGDWKREHQQARDKERTAASWVAWRDDRITQAAVAWVLITVFIRFCEDNSLVGPVWITGPENRRQEALDAQLAYFRAHPEHTNREWLESAIDYLAGLPATKALVESRSALHLVSPSGDAVTKLLDFWRKPNNDGTIAHDLKDKSLSTRFLGDIYQDLSQHAKEVYSLLQTPVFVEEFILDQTLEPALKERSLEGFKLIDPTCGSGHFLLGAFDRLLERWNRHAPGLEIQARAQQALNSIYGVDLNPFAIAISYFRLTVASLKACGQTSLEKAPAFTINLAVGDSLIHGPDRDVLPGMGNRAAFMPFTYATEDGPSLLAILEQGSYDVVVGNPPYDAARDRKLNQIYRSRFPRICRGTFPLSIPFVQLFFELAKQGSRAGRVGQITSNSFMTRESGSLLVEDFLPHQNLELIIDTSGVYFGRSGFKTPTVIMIGTRQEPNTSLIRCVFAIRGVGAQEGDPASSPAWCSIARNFNRLDYSDQWIRVSDIERTILSTHPWSLGGTDVIDALSRIEQKCHSKLNYFTTRIGYMGMSHADEAFQQVCSLVKRRDLERDAWPQVVDGSALRDYMGRPSGVIFLPYDESAELMPLEVIPNTARWLWPLRVSLGGRATFSGGTYTGEGRPWYEWHQLPRDESASSMTVAYAEVATHNHFYLPRNRVVFKQTAPIIRFKQQIPADEISALLGALNSSTACFWLRNKTQRRGGDADQPWLRTYQFNATTVRDYPLPRQLSGLAIVLRLLKTATEVALIESNESDFKVRTHEQFAQRQAARAELAKAMIALQEELDWQTYYDYGLTSEPLTAHNLGELPLIESGERAFAIMYAQELADQGDKSGLNWFTYRSHHFTPTVTVPQTYPAWYRNLITQRIDAIRKSSVLSLIERPEYKRRWERDPQESQVREVAMSWLLDQLEDRRFWFDAQGRPLPRTVAQLADEVGRDADLVSVLALWEGRPDVPVTQSLVRLLADMAVPFLAAYRYKDSGLRKREAWEETWKLQRREDAGEKVQPIPVPPKYASTDFRKNSYWQARGKLDMPKERFILYPDAGRETDSTPLLGWAGWDHAQQSLALSLIIGQREKDGWADERLVPLVAGLAELQPWVNQWHSEVDPDYGVSLAAFCREQLTARAAQVGKTLDELAAWRQAAARGAAAAEAGMTSWRTMRGWMA